MRRWIGLVAAVLLLGACQGQPSQKDTARAADAATTSALTARAGQAEVAAGKLVAMSQGSATSGQAPRQDDPAAGPLLDQVFDTSALPALGRTPADLTQMSRWLAAVMKVGQVYVLAGTGFTDPTKATTDAAQAQSLRNVVDYAPETGRFFDAATVLLSVEGASIDYQSIVNSAKIDPGQRESVMTDLQYKIEKTYSSELGFMLNKGPTDAWKEARIKVLATEATRVSGMLLPGSWGHLQQQARQIAAQSDDPVLKRYLELFATRIEPPQ
jgi:hypothetical protein